MLTCMRGIKKKKFYLKPKKISQMADFACFHTHSGFFFKRKMRVDNENEYLKSYGPGVFSVNICLYGVALSQVGGSTQPVRSEPVRSVRVPLKLQHCVGWRIFCWNASKSGSWPTLVYIEECGVWSGACRGSHLPLPPLVWSWAINLTLLCLGFFIYLIWVSFPQVR